MSDKIIVFDTTLRDGEQSPGASMNAAEKVRLAVQLEKLGVDVIEAGFPAASDGDFDAVEKIAAKLEKSESRLWRGLRKKTSTAPGGQLKTQKNRGFTPSLPLRTSI